MGTSTTAPEGEKVVPIHPKKAKQVSEKKWSKVVMAQGFCIVPSILLRAQQRLGLNPTHLVILLQLAEYWWDEDRKPYPSKRDLSGRLGLSPRQIQRHIAALERRGFVRRNERHAARGGKSSNEYDLSGLVEHLKKLAPEIAEANEQKRQVTRRGGLRKKAAAKE